MPGYVDGLKFSPVLKNVQLKWGLSVLLELRSSVGSFIQVVCLYNCGRLSVGLATGYI